MTKGRGARSKVKNEDSSVPSITGQARTDAHFASTYFHDRIHPMEDHPIYSKGIAPGKRGSLVGNSDP